MADRLVTDIGGTPAGAIPREEREPLFWERQLIATFNVLQQHGVLVIDEIRRTVEEMPKEAYDESTFYGRRVEAVADILIKKGVITAEELEERTREILESGTRDHVR
jgi:nitrile hydratase subunit beta